MSATTCAYCHETIGQFQSYMVEGKRLFHTVCWFKATSHAQSTSEAKP